MSDSISPRRPLLRPWRLLGWGTLLLLLSLPAILRFPWDAFDFVVMGMLLASVGLGIEFLVRRTGSTLARLGAVVAVIATFLTIWANLAVGMIGSEDNPYNLLFLAVPGLVLVGGLAVRLRPGPMTLVLIMAAILQLGLALGGLSVDPRGARFSAYYVVFWLIAAAFYHGAAVGARGSTR